jgi:hypothetical protein
MAVQNLGATGTRDANQDQLFSLFSCLPTAFRLPFFSEAETSERRRFLGSTSQAISLTARQRTMSLAHKIGAGKKFLGERYCSRKAAVVMMLPMRNRGGGDGRSCAGFLVARMARLTTR